MEYFQFTRHSKYLGITFLNPKYRLSEIRACPIETSSKLGMFWAKYAKFFIFKSCPALTPIPNSFAFSAAKT